MSVQPIIFVVSDNDGLARLETAVRTRYDIGWRIEAFAERDTAYARLADCRKMHEPVAMVIYDQAEAGLAGADFLDHCELVYANARKLLIADESNGQAAIAALNSNNIEHYLTQPWEPITTRLYPIIDELLAQWRATEELPFMFVKGVMTVRAVRIRLDDTLYRAAEIITLSSVEDLMVIDGDGYFVGVLSVGDILRAAMPDRDEIMAEGGSLQQVFQLFLRKGSELMYKPIKPLVITEPITISPDDHVAKVATVLLEKNIGRLPVVRNGRLLGTVSRADICQAVVGAI